ncbi:histidine protein methyltransferase 1 homolog [Anopheles maculipalpis]|uniref:histidine protein methyltransferase 1 homolog n=1 Tax=Anopheles maculipalpis TaxID=1496333 RepID=UPI0021597307|nr:histidine protein methyltransferase 1 homolog [Anopheles maculipalpis]
MFKFTFQVEPDEEISSTETKDEEPKPTAERKESSCAEKENPVVYPCEELTFDASYVSNKSAINPDVTSTFQPAPNCSIEYLNQLALLDETFTDDIVTAESDHSDLIPNRYEGGLKVWECTYDLGEFLATSEERKTELQGRKVLDLGCGAGILGIEALLLGSSCVHFQDYNKDVLTKLTMVNYDLNCRTTNDTDKEDRETLPPTGEVKFFSGDWGCFTDQYQHKYDLILTSETIYSTDNYSKLLQLFDRKLEPDGVVYLAAKTYYFGVGGGVRLFEQAIDKDGRFQHKVVWSCETGVKREIVRITRK